ncbi:MAG: hypothetical protein LBG92_11340 [Prevotellaceae bacterium]|jgi:transposase|nr:hypothetical protein [Prevotellaceae bacterium]
MTSEKLQRIQVEINHGKNIRSIAKTEGISDKTIRNAIGLGKLTGEKK